MSRLQSALVALGGENFGDRKATREIFECIFGKHVCCILWKQVHCIELCPYDAMRLIGLDFALVSHELQMVKSQGLCRKD